LIAEVEAVIADEAAEETVDDTDDTVVAVTELYMISMTNATMTIIVKIKRVFSTFIVSMCRYFYYQLYSHSCTTLSPYTPDKTRPYSNGDHC
jgi:hypothetical protein